MRLRLVLACAGVLVLASCTALDVAPPRTETPSSTPSEVATTPAVAPVAVPSRSAGEISRDVYTGKLYDIPASTNSLDLRAACAGTPGTRMRYQVQDGKGHELTAGNLACTGHEVTDRISGDLPRAAPIHLDADSGVTNGWATLSHH